MTPKPQTKKPQLPTTQEVEATNPQSEDDWVDAMPFICNNIRSDGTVCENIIESNDDLYAPHAVTCGTCFDDAENPQPKKPRNPKHRTMSFRKARLMREAEEAALIEDGERHADMELEQAAELDAIIRGEEE